MKPVRAGRLRFAVSIQSSTDTRNTLGEPVEVWATISSGDVQADIEPISAREYQSVQQIAAETTHRVTIRYLAGITAKHRVLYGSRVFDIMGVRNLEERGRVTELLCRERD